MAHISRDPTHFKDDERLHSTPNRSIGPGYYAQIPPEYHFEKPAIDRLLDHVWNQEARTPAIDKLIQEYLERMGSPSVYRCSSYMSPIVVGEMGNDNKLNGSTSSQQTQTPNRQRVTRGIQHYQSAQSLFQTPMTSGTDSMLDSTGCCNNFDFQNTASTPLLRPISTRSYRTSLSQNEGPGNTPSRLSTSSAQEIPIVDRYANTNNGKDSRLKRAAAQERRQATRHFGKVHRV